MRRIKYLKCQKESDQERTVKLSLNNKQESIPVGCVSSAAVAVGGGVCLGGGVSEGDVCPGGVCLGEVGVSAKGSVCLLKSTLGVSARQLSPL